MISGRIELLDLHHVFTLTTCTNHQELKRRIFELEEENATLKHDMTRDITNPLAERDSTISVLRHTISGLERQLQECMGEDTEVLNKLAQIQEVGKLLVWCLQLQFTRSNSRGRKAESLVASATI